MAENREKKQVIWLETDIEPIQEFENKEFARLMRYADENQKHLMKLLYNEYSDELRLGCKFGNSKLHFFENAILEDEMLLTVFKLGELYGHIECLGTIEYESAQDSHALARFQKVTTQLPKLENEIKKLLKFLYKNGNEKEKELLNVVQVKLVDLMQILHILFINGLINVSDICGYSLSDMGLRLAKKLNDK